MRQTIFSRLRCWVIFAALVGCVTACAYRPALIQGNAITQDMMQKIKPGMDKNAVLDVLGTPLLVSLFHEGRWDYVFVYDNNKRDRAAIEYRVTLYFKGDTLERVDSPQPLPTNLELNALIAQ